MSVISIMRSRCFFTVLCCAAAFSTANAATDCEVNGQSVSPYNGSTTAGLTGIMRCVDRESKQLVREEELRVGKSVGVQRRYENGKLIRESNVNERGNRDGQHKEFAPSGQLLRDEIYHDGSNRGLQKYFHDNGGIKRLAFYDEKQSVAHAEFTPIGRLSELRCAAKPLITFGVFSDRKACGFDGQVTTELFNGERVHGRRVLLNGHILFSENFSTRGVLQTQFERRDNKLTERRFNQAGVKMKEFGFVENDGTRLRVYEQDFHESGVKTSEKQWGAVSLASESTWYLNGQLRSQSVYVDMSTVRREFYDNGKLAAEREYLREGRNTLPTGDHKSFDTTGTLRSVVSFDRHGKRVRERNYDENGVLKADDAVFEDGSRKAYAK